MSLSSQECPICFRKATLVRSQIENYECRCDYYLHRSCYERWITETGTDRLCLICDVREVRAEVRGEDQEQGQEQGQWQEVQAIIQYGTEVARIDDDEMIDRRFRNNCCRSICEEIVITAGILVYGTVMIILYLRQR